MITVESADKNKKYKFNKWATLSLSVSAEEPWKK